MYNTSLTFTKFENKELNVSVNTHIDGKKVWFKALEYKQPGKAIIDHIKDNGKRKVQQASLFQNGKVVKSMISLINEPGLYKIIFSSKFECPERFKSSVSSQVLPSIRKYGYYRIK